jgi:hypothetical protein
MEVMGDLEETGLKKSKPSRSSVLLDIARSEKSSD